MSEHVQHKGDQDAEILLQVSGKQVEHKHALGIWLKTKSWLEDLIPVTSSIFHMGQRKENLYLRKKSNETPASMHELLADEELEPELGLTGKQVLLPDCLLKTIEIKSSEKAGILTIQVSHRSLTI
nr:PREDICTED: uncharacterized protein LOC108953632 isoform X1 [Musa acuminata subsp. malaccensis]